MLRLLERATANRVPLPSLTSTDCVNTIPTTLEPEFPGDAIFDLHHALRLRLELFRIGAVCAVDGNTTTTGDEAEDGVAYTIL